MKRIIYKIWLCLLTLSLSFLNIAAQTGITVYSDTSNTLPNSDNDTAYQNAYNYPAYPDPDFVWDEDGGSGIFNILSSLLGLTGGLLTLILLIFIFFPVIAIGIIIYLVCQLNRERKRNQESGPAPGFEIPKDKEAQMRLLRERAIRLACWGAGVIIINFIAFDSTLILIVGVVLLCIAAADWLITVVRKRE